MGLGRKPLSMLTGRADGREVTKLTWRLVLLSEFREAYRLYLEPESFPALSTQITLHTHHHFMIDTYMMLTLMSMFGKQPRAREHP
jgi:hypothetical protein